MKPFPFSQRYVGFMLLSLLFMTMGVSWLYHLMDSYAWFVLVLAMVAHAFLARLWPSWQIFTLVAVTLSIAAVLLYQNDLARSEQQFLLKYFLSSQSALIWMVTLSCLAAFLLNLGWLFRQPNFYPSAYVLYWGAAVLCLVSLVVRWRESYLLAPDIGHIPISNLYEVFVLFVMITILMLLYYREKFKIDAAGAPISWAISLSLLFMVWYSMARDAHIIQPLTSPGLASWWIKIHVPANFIGYGAFSIAAMLGVYYLIRPDEGIASWMYQIIAMGFLFFTLATILGAMWAAEAWGGYWSWDIKEVAALILWLNYAAWLHVRLIKGWQGRVLAWWAVLGYFLTIVAFLGVNLYGQGFHSYGNIL